MQGMTLEEKNIHTMIYLLYILTVLTRFALGKLMQASITSELVFCAYLMQYKKLGMTYVR